MDGLDLGALYTKIKVDGAEKAKNEFKKIADVTEELINKFKKSEKTYSTFTDIFKNSLNSTNLFGTTLGTLKEAFGKTETASVALGTALGGMATYGIKLAGDALIGLGKAILSITFGTIIDGIKGMANACKEFVQESIQIGIGFQAQMKKVQAISGGTAEDLNALTESARQFGKDTVFSATDVAKAFEYTALAGYNTSQSVNAMRGILDLAASSDMDLARASDIVTDNLTAFNLETEKANHLSDVMAYTMSHTNTNTEQLGEAYKAVASTATSFNVSMEECTAWLGNMANAGYKGEQAGTALNAVLARLYGETKTTNDALMQYGLTMYDTNGKAKNFTQVMGEIQEAMKGMTDQERNVFLKNVAGTNQLAKFAVMCNVSAGSVNELTKSLETCDGTSANMVKTMTDNIDGLQKAINSKIESIKISVFTALEPIKYAFTSLVDAILGIVSTIAQPIGTIVGSFLSIFKPIFSGFNRLIAIFSELISDVLEPFTQLFTHKFGIIGDTVQFVVDLIIGGVQLIVDFIHPLIDIFSTIISVVTQIGTAIQQSILQKFPQVKTVFDEFVTGFKNGFLLIPNLIITAVNRCIDVINQIPGMAVEKIDYLTEEYAISMQEMGDKTADFIGSAENAMEDYGAMIDDITNANYTNFEDMYNAIMELDDETFDKLKGNVESYKNEYDIMTDALDEFEREKSREIMKTWEETNKSREGSMQYYLDKAKQQATVEEALHNRTAKERERIDKEYTSKVEKELKTQKGLYEKYNTKNYQKDYDEFAKNEEKKTKKVETEMKKRNSFSSSLGATIGKALANTVFPGTGILGAFANGTSNVKQSGVYRVGEFGTEYVHLPKGASVTPNNRIDNNNNADMIKAINQCTQAVQGVYSYIDNITWKQKNNNQVWG